MARRNQRVTAASAPEAEHPAEGVGRLLGTLVAAPTRAFREVLASEGKRSTAPDAGGKRFPVLLAGLGGASLFLLLLKVGSLVGARDACRFSWAYLVLSGITGALLGLLVQLLWGWLGRLLVGSSDADVATRTLRKMWGLAAAPHLLGLLLLLPLDLLIVGPESFLSQPLDGTFQALWAGLSIALGIALTVWTLFLLARGLEVAGLSRGKAWSSAVAGGMLSLVVIGGFLVLAGAFGGETSCPSQRT